MGDGGLVVFLCSRGVPIVARHFDIIEMDLRQAIVIFSWREGALSRAFLLASERGDHLGHGGVVIELPSVVRSETQERVVSADVEDLPVEHSLDQDLLGVGWVPEDVSVVFRPRTELAE
jgi:hypothetical protein